MKFAICRLLNLEVRFLPHSYHSVLFKSNAMSPNGNLVFKTHLELNEYSLDKIILDGDIHITLHIQTVTTQCKVTLKVVLYKKFFSFSTPPLFFDLELLSIWWYMRAWCFCWTSVSMCYLHKYFWVTERPHLRDWIFLVAECVAAIVLALARLIIAILQQHGYSGCCMLPVLAQQYCWCW